MTSHESVGIVFNCSTVFIFVSSIISQLYPQYTYIIYNIYILFYISFEIICMHILVASRRQPPAPQCVISEVPPLSVGAEQIWNRASGEIPDSAWYTGASTAPETITPVFLM